MKDYFSDIQNILWRSALIENVEVEYDVEVGIASYGGRRKRGLINYGMV